MRPRGSFPLVVRAADELVPDSDALDHEDLVLDNHIALRLGAEPALAGVDPARLQRATQGAGQSTGGGCDDVVERRGVIGVLAGSRAVMLPNLIVGTEEDRLWLDGQVGPADRASLANDPHLRYVGRLIHT